MSDADKLIVKKILNGDLRVFRTLIEKHERLVSHMVYRMISNPADQEEICQEVFIRIYQNLSAFKFKAKLSTWIARIAYHTTINFLRKEKLTLIDDRATDHADYEKSNEDSLDRIPFENMDPAPDEIFEAKDRRRQLEKQINQLPPPFRTILTLFHLEQMSYEEISEIMDLPAGTVKNYLFRARKKLKEVLEKELKGEEL